MGLGHKNMKMQPRPVIFVHTSTRGIDIESALRHKKPNPISLNPDTEEGATK